MSYFSSDSSLFLLLLHSSSLSFIRSSLFLRHFTMVFPRRLSFSYIFFLLSLPSFEHRLILSRFSQHYASFRSHTLFHFAPSLPSPFPPLLLTFPSLSVPSPLFHCLLVFLPPPTLSIPYPCHPSYIMSILSLPTFPHPLFPFLLSHHKPLYIPFHSYFPSYQTHYSGTVLTQPSHPVFP